jgi:hypothetical protein
MAKEIKSQQTEDRSIAVDWLVYDLIPICNPDGFSEIAIVEVIFRTQYDEHDDDPLQNLIRESNLCWL